MKDFIKKKGARIVVTVLLILSIGFNFKLFFDLKNNMKKAGRINVVGTFITDNPINPEYFVFSRDNKFYYYRQFQFIKHGTYTLDRNIITLNIKDSHEYVVYISDPYSSEKIYYLNQEKDAVFEFNKIADYGIFANVQISELEE